MDCSEAAVFAYILIYSSVMDIRNWAMQFSHKCVSISKKEKKRASSDTQISASPSTEPDGDDVGVEIKCCCVHHYE